MFQKLNDSIYYSCTNRREVTVISGLHVGYSYNLLHSFLLDGEEAPVCILCNVLLTMDWVLEISYLPILLWTGF